MNFIYDVETYPNGFTMAVIRESDGYTWQYEISQARNDSISIKLFLTWLRNNGHRMVGFNNVGFDYPIIHMIIHEDKVTSYDLYQKAMDIINGGRFENRVWESQWYVPQVDLFLIHHFDNPARATSLKALEFNMRMDNVEDLPFKPGTLLNREQIEVLHKYNLHDVRATHRFLAESKEAIEFREELSKKYKQNFINFNDTKIGKFYFAMRLEESRPGSCYIPGTRKQPRRTKRDVIHLGQCIFPYVKFENREFADMKYWLTQQSIRETKGLFKKLSCTVNGFKFVFGLGGIHGSVEFREIHEDDEYEIVDLDVTSYYPSIAIVNRVYPEHLGEMFCDVYQEVFEERRHYPKGTVENAIYKLALNGVFGDSNNKYSPFYDPKYTMTITINGQLLLCMLAEWLMTIPGVEMIQVNTDGLTIKSPRNQRHQIEVARTSWEKYTGLDLEEAVYSDMYIRDVNNYLAIGKDGKIKRKGAYEYKRDWHQNQSALVVPKAAEAHLIHGEDIGEFIRGHQNLYDFMLRVKLPKNMRLELLSGEDTTPLQNMTRYYVTQKGGYLKKIMPPLKDQTEERIRDIESGWRVTPCNNIEDAIAPINYDYYIKETEKLTLELH